MGGVGNLLSTSSSKSTAAGGVTVKGGGKNSTIGNTNVEQGLGAFNFGAHSTSGVTSPVILSPTINVQNPDTSGGGGSVANSPSQPADAGSAGALSTNILSYGRIGIIVVAVLLAVWYFLKRK